LEGGWPTVSARFLRLSPAQSDIPVSVVKKNPSKQIFLTKKGGEKGVFSVTTSYIECVAKLF
jgi:hypothetical protein